MHPQSSIFFFWATATRRSTQMMSVSRYVVSVTRDVLQRPRYFAQITRCLTVINFFSIQIKTIATTEHFTAASLVVTQCQLPLDYVNHPMAYACYMILGSV